MPVYAEEATSSASLALDKISEATQSATEFVQKLIPGEPQAQIPSSLPLPFDSTQSRVTITSGFGEKREVFTDHIGEQHNGLDFDLKSGTPILAVDDGEVLVSGNDDYGITVTIQHNWGKSVYGHLSKTEVSKNQKVAKGQEIGLSGSTGNSTNPHLHFGIKRDEPNNIDGFIDPAPYFNLGKSNNSDPLLEATAAANLQEQILGATTPEFEDLRNKAGFLYNYKFNFQNESSVHFDHKKRSEPGFAVVDKDANYKLRFFLKEGSSSLRDHEVTKQSQNTGIAASPTAPRNDAVTDQTLTIKENDLGFLRVRSDPTTGSEELEKLAPGQEFKILEEKAGWYKIEYEEGKFGWVSGVYVSVPSALDSVIPGDKPGIQAEENLDSGSEAGMTNGEDESNPKITGNIIEYPVTISGIPMTLRYTLSGNQVKEEFIIDQKPSPETLEKLKDNLSIQFSVENEGLKTEALGEGSYKFILDNSVIPGDKPGIQEPKSMDPGSSSGMTTADSSSQDYWQIQKPNVKDSEGKEGQILGELKDNTYSLQLTTNYLAEASYPVIIDPTVLIANSSTTLSNNNRTQKSFVRTSDGTLHAFIQMGTQSATCAGVSSKQGLGWFNSTDSGATWTCQAQLSSDTTSLYNASAVADTSDNIYVIYSISSNSSNSVHDVYYHKLTKGGGATWTVGAQQKLLDAGSTEAYAYADIALEGTTRFWVALRYYDNATYQVKSYYSNGLTDTATVTLSLALDTAGNGPSSHIPLIVRYSTNIGVIWVDQAGANTQWRFRKDADGLSSWSNASIVNSTLANAGMTAISDSAGNIYFAGTPGSTVNFNYYNGTSWSPTATVTTTNAAVAPISLSTDGTNVWVFSGDSTNLTTNSTFAGRARLAYKKGVSPFTSQDFEASATSVVSYHGSFDKYWSFVASAYTDDTTDAGNTTASDTQMVTNSGDIMYFGKTAQFDAISAFEGTSGSGGTLAWEYCSAVDGSTVCTTWSTLTLTYSTSPNFTAAASSIAFTAPADWVAAKVNSESTAYYYVRGRATANYSNPLIGTQFNTIPSFNSMHVLPSPVSGTIYAIWSENSASVVKARTSSVSVTASTAPSTTAELTPTVVGYSSNAAATQLPSQKHLVRTSDGTLHAFVQNGTLLSCSSSTSSNSAVGLNWLYSTDSGTTWTCGGQLSDTTVANYASAVIDSSDNIYAAYSQATATGGTTKTIYYRKLTKGSGATWTLEAQQAISTMTGTSTIGYHYADLNIEGTTRLWVAARYYDGANYQVAVSYSDGLTAAPTWTASTTTLDTANSTGGVAHIPMVVRYASNIGVIYELSGATLSWRHRSDSDGLTTWAPETAVSSTSNIQGGGWFSAVGNSNGTIFLIVGPNSQTLQFTTWNGSAWTVVNNFTTTASNNTTSANYQVATDGTNAWLIYGDANGFTNVSNTGNRKLVYKKCTPPFTAQDCDSSSTSLISRHGIFDKVWTYISSSYVDDTTDAGNTTTADVAMPTAVGDIMYFGSLAKFDAVDYDLSTAGDTTAGRVVWEYWNGSAWMQLTNINSASSSSFGGDGLIGFAPNTDWSTTTVNGEGTPYYYVRSRVTNAYTTTPVGVQFANLPMVSNASFTQTIASGNIYGIWTEGLSNAKVRTSSFSVTASSAPSTTAEISSPSYVTSSTSTNATGGGAPAIRPLVRTSDGTIHNFVHTGTNAACGNSTSSNNTPGLNWIYSTDSGTTWTCGGQMDSSTSIYHASAVADSSDNIYVVYSLPGNGASASNSIFFRKFTKGSGSTWTMGSAHTILTGSASVGYAYATIEAEGTTRLWLALRYFDGTNYQIPVYYSNGMTPAASGDWTQSIANLDTIGTSNSTHIASIVRFGSKIGVIYSDNSTGFKWRYRNDSDGLTSWVAEATVSSGFIVAGVFSVSGDTSGNLYVVGQAGTTAEFTYYNGSTWTSRATISTASTSGGPVSVSNDGTSAYVLYTDATGLSGAAGRKLVYKKVVSPFATGNVQSAVAVVSYQDVFDKVWRYISSSYTDETTDAGNSTTADVTIPSTAGDIIYFGKSAKFDSVAYGLSTAGDTTGRVAWEYWNGSTWMSLAIPFVGDDSAFENSGFISFTPHTDWATTTVNGEGTSYYYVRARVTTTYPTTAPVGAQMSSTPLINSAKLANSSQGLYGTWTENGSANEKVRYSTIQSFNATPSDPSSLGSATMVDGSFGSDNTPDLTFTLSDTDSSDTLKYQIQIDDSSNFSSAVVDYTSALAAQGSRTFTVGQAAGSGTYTTGSEGQTLSDGSYYWRVRATDNSSATGSYSTANSGSIAFKIDTTNPTTPGTPSPTTAVTDNTPSWSWTASTDAGSGLAATPYTVQWSQSSTFASGVNSSTSTTNSFTHSTSLINGTWYFRVKAADALGFESSYSSAGSIVLAATGPSAPDLQSPGDNSFTNNSRPSFVWKNPADVSNFSKYSLEIDNGDSGDIIVDNIPISRTTNLETAQYVLVYDGFSDSDTGNNYISFYTKSSSDWAADQDNGQLKEGKRSWLVKVTDIAGNTAQSGRTLYADYTVPQISEINLENLGEVDKYLVTILTNPKTSGSVSDNLGLDKIDLSYYKENSLLGILLSKTLTLSDIYSFSSGSTILTESDFSSVASKDLDYGKYSLKATLYDKAGNTTEANINFQLLTEEKARQLLKGKEDLKDQAKVSIAELEKQARIRLEKQQAELQKLLAFLRENLGEYYLVMEKFITQALASSFSVIASGTELAYNLTDQGLTHVSLAVIDGTNQAGYLAKLAGQNTLSFTTSVLPAQATAGAIAFYDVNKAINNSFYIEEEKVRDNIIDDYQQNGQALVTFVASLNSVVPSLESSKDSLATKMSETGTNLSSQLSETNKSLLDGVDKLTQAGELALNSAKKPLTGATDFMQRVGVGADTFVAIVFDNDPTKIANVTIEEIGEDYAIISWETNHFATGKVNYGSDLSYGQEIFLEKREKYHQAKLTGLKKGERYFFEVMSEGKNYTYDAYYSFETK